jgi:hypothetical protein
VLPYYPCSKRQVPKKFGRVVHTGFEPVTIAFLETSVR